MAEDNKSEGQEEKNLIKEILGEDLDVKVLNFEQVKQVMSYLEGQGLRIGRMAMSLADANGYNWRDSKNILHEIDTPKALYLDCIVRAGELGKLDYWPVTG